MSVKVEIGFSATAPSGLFTLDDPVKGVLDSVYVLDGVTWTEVTQFATHISLNRGKSRELDRFEAASLTVDFNNKGREFDPTYVLSPYYGQIVPRKPVRYSVDGYIEFVGVIDDWNLSYKIDGDSSASLTAYDGFTSFTGQVLTPQTYSSQLSGDRIKTILTDPNVNWGLTRTRIDDGTHLLQGDTVVSGQDVLAYINNIENSEFGLFFIDRQGNAVWKQAYAFLDTSSAPIFSDNGTGIGYDDVSVIYGSELLYNQAILTRAGGSAVFTGNEYVSQGTYGIRTLTIDGLLNNSDSDVENLAAFYVNNYKDPEYRFEWLQFPLHSMSPANRGVMLATDIGDFVQIIFTPNRIGDSISLYAQVIGVEHTADFNGEHLVTLKFQKFNNAWFTLDDPVFGKLDFNNRLGF
jgi:hypothetical protein